MTRVAHAACALVLVARGALAEPFAVAPPSRGQPALAVGFVNGALEAQVCPTDTCRPEGGTSIAVDPEAIAERQRGKLSIVRIAENRVAVHLTIPVGDRQWETIVAAPAGRGGPKVVWNGWTGFLNGQHGLRSGPRIEISEPAEDGTRRILVGEQREDVSLCDRPTILSPKLLSPKDLSLAPAKVQRLSTAERDQAPDLTATRVTGSLGLAAGALRAIVATSGTRPDMLTDGNPETTWSEGRGGSGRGEFVVLQNKSPDLPVSGFELAVRPLSSTVGGASPKRLYLATTKLLFSVTLPEDGFAEAGTRYHVALPKPVTAACVAIVLDTAFDESTKASVTLTEITATTDLNPADVPGLVAKLDADPEKAAAAAALLVSIGASGIEALIEAFPKLKATGRTAVLDAIDGVPCDVGALVYAVALTSKFRGHRDHARGRILRCGESGAPGLVLAMAKAKAAARIAISSELAIVSPARAVRAIAEHLPGAAPRARPLFRSALARAIASGRADAEVRGILGGTKLDEATTLDFLRSLGERASRLAPEASRAFARVATPGASFETRFRLLHPASGLARTDATARAFLDRAITADESHHVRAEAARAAVRVGDHPAALLAALGDENVRVREAAAATLGQGRAKFAAGALAARLATDQWPLVRSAAARALGPLGPDRALDELLVNALEDESRHVRHSVVVALGERRAITGAEAVRDRLGDDEEDAEVRAAAARALGSLCDYEAVDILTTHARRLADPFAPEVARFTGTAAVWALGQLKPPDLAKRLAPLRGKTVRNEVRGAVDAALRERGSCGSPT